MTAFLALLASVLWGATDYGGGTLSRRLPVTVALLGSQVTAVVVLGVGLGVPGVHVGFGGYLVYGALAGLLGTLGLFAFYQAMATGPMSVVAPVSACGTAIPVVYGLLRGEHVMPVQGLGIAVAFVGVILVSGPELHGGAGGRRTVLLSLGAAAGFGSVFLFSGLGAPHGVYGTMLAEQFVGLLLVLPAAWARRDLRGITWDRRTVALSVLVGFGDLAAIASYLGAARGSHLAVVSVLSSLYPVVTTLLARYLLAERLRSVQNAGVVAALAGIVLINL
ncbi:DMT family transporter [Streptomyces sp. SL13]|uniref:DMT family transporter n=1 Tax=Streptantibioticus silvisoli TaxID=2705255 RepID=A0AA90H5F1_9ACTN|nr:DMT family transporter [Streptantibioticus silvisoli]MDI5970712.1 DMT family transporter [Streptantibioticus silvisoli]